MECCKNKGEVISCKAVFDDARVLGHVELELPCAHCKNIVLHKLEPFRIPICYSAVCVSRRRTSDSADKVAKTIACRLVDGRPIARVELELRCSDCKNVFSYDLDRFRIPVYCSPACISDRISVLAKKVVETTGMSQLSLECAICGCRMSVYQAVPSTAPLCPACRNMSSRELRLRDVRLYSTRKDKHWSLGKLGTKFGMSKERVRQIYLRMERQEVDRLYAEVAILELKASGQDMSLLSVDDLGFSVRSHNCMRNANIRTAGELIYMSEKYLLKTKNFGRESLKEIRGVLSALGLSLQEENDRNSRVSATQERNTMDPLTRALRYRP